MHYFFERRKMLDAQAYTRRVLKTKPFYYGVMGEPSGLVSVDEVNSPAQDGVYQGVTLGQDGIGDGNTSALFDGTNDYNNIQTATFSGAFNGREGSTLLWSRVANAGVWTDGALRQFFIIQADANNRVLINKHFNANRIDYTYKAGGTTEFRSVTFSGVDWFSVMITWSLSSGINGEVRVYLNGLQQGAIMTALGTWVGAPVLSVVGAISLVPANVWDGTLSNMPVWTRALTPAEALSVGVL